MKRTKSLLARNSLLIGLLALSAGLFSQAVAAGGRYFGSGAPRSSAELPTGELRKSIEALPPATQARALQWLQSVEFTGQDLPYMQVDRQGSIYYADTFMTSKSESPKAADGSGQQGITARNVLKLHSQPGAANTIFVDFDGATISGKAWNNHAGYFRMESKTL